jgi:hypothetical protein
MAAWNLVTEPDEIDRCCVVIDDRRCGQRTAWRITGAAWDDYTYTCSDHVELATTPGHVVVPVAIARCVAGRDGDGQDDADHDVDDAAGAACAVHGLVTVRAVGRG